MWLIRVAICMPIKELSKSNRVLTVCHVWTFLTGSTRVSATEGHVGLPKRKSCSFFSQNLVISFITRGDITRQESSQCVTEQCRSVQPSVTCVSSVLVFAHARSHSSETTTSHLFYNQQFGATIQLFATTRLAIPTLYAHASTQHNNERLVKLGALMSSTGKSEIMASIFAIASNEFITEHHDDEGEDTTDLEIPANQPAVAEDKPKRRKRGNYRGKKKLLDLEREMVKKSKQLAVIATNLGAQAYTTRMNAIATSLKSKADNLLERSSDLKVRMMMASFDMPDKQANARQQKRGEDMS
jgi:hypothetical protein